MDEPSVLDYLKDRLQFWRAPKLHLPDPNEPERIAAWLSANKAAGPVYSERLAVAVQPLEPLVQEKDTAEPDPGEQPARVVKIPWLALGGMFVALVAQLVLEPGPSSPSARSTGMGIFFYVWAAALIGVALWRGQWLPASLRENARSTPPVGIRFYPLLVAIAFFFPAFVFFGNPGSTGDAAGGLNNLISRLGGERFTPFNLFLWAMTLVFFLAAVWQPSGLAERLRSRIDRTLNPISWRISITPFALFTVVVIALVVFFRFYRLDSVPPEMVSDHAEKLLDVQDVLNGHLATYFTRNTGREFLQFYMTAAVVLLFNTGISFLALKVGTAIASLATLPYMYLLGKEIGNRWVGILAVLMAGMAYWTNMFTRIGLRFALYPLFVAPCLFYLVRGLRTRSRNDFILSGIALGIGLHGYTSIRILPLLVVLGVALYLVHRQSKGARQQTVFHLALLSSAALILFLPLLRYWLAHPDMFALRAFSRMTGLETPLPGPALQIFSQNLWRASTMFFWDNGEIWVHSVTHRPALDVISAALFFAGLVLVLARYFRQRNWVDLFLLVSVPVLMLPSILSLAFPAENPSLNRTSGAIVPVFLICAIALEGLLAGLRRWIPGRAGVLAAAGLGLALLVPSAAQNYDLVFNQYQVVYQASSWNTSEMGKVMRAFADSVGNRDSAWVIGYPYWVDTRLVGINAGFPEKDYAIWPDQIPDTVNVPYVKLFLLNLLDSEGLQALQQTYPNGTLRVYPSAVPGKEFYMYLVQPDEGTLP